MSELSKQFSQQRFLLKQRFNTIFSTFYSKRFLFYAIVGIGGMIINTLTLLFLLDSLSLPIFVISMVATEVAIIFNFFGNDFLTFREEVKKKIRQKKSDRTSHDKKSTRLKRFFTFQTISLITVLGTATLVTLFVTQFGTSQAWIGNIIAIGIMFIFNYVLNSTITWGG